MTPEELERYKTERRWRDYRPNAGERRFAPCKWGIRHDDDSCRILGCPRHDPSSSSYWVRFAEAKEKAARGSSAESCYKGGLWRTVVDGQVIYEGDSQTAANWLANGALKVAATGGVLTYHDQSGIATGVHWLEPDPEDDLYATYYREHMGISRPTHPRLRLSTLAERVAA